MPTLGKYELIEELGRGGFGTVYRARDTALDVERAVKVLHPALTASPEFIERFRREGRFAARLEHLHIVPVYELGETQGSYYLVMKYLSGGSLKDLLAGSGPLPFAESVEITRQVANALTYAYQQPEKLIHRDLKPGNILFESLPPDPKGVSARLSDFGFAKALSNVDSGSLSSSGGLLGTPAYIAPEIWDDMPAGPASDQYSLACVLYEMLTGQVLFSGSTPMALMKNMAAGPKFPATWPDGVPAAIETVLRRGLSVNPEERYPDVTAFSAACVELFAPKPTVVATVPKPVEPPQVKTLPSQTPRPHHAVLVPTPKMGTKSKIPVWAIFGLTIVCLIIGAAGGLDWLANRPDFNRADTVLPTTAIFSANRYSTASPTATITVTSLMKTPSPTQAITKNITLIPTLILTFTLTPMPASSTLVCTYSLATDDPKFVYKMEYYCNGQSCFLLESGMNKRTNVIEWTFRERGDYSSNYVMKETKMHGGSCETVFVNP